MSIPASIVTEAGRLRENVRGYITVTVDAVDLAVIEIITRTHVEQIVLSGDHLAEFSDELSRAVRKAKRARLRAVTA